MSRALPFYIASTGVAAVDASVNLVGAWLSCRVGQPLSFQTNYGAGLTGTFRLQGTNTLNPVYNTAGTTIGESNYWTAPTQPSGSAGLTSINILATHESVRLIYDRTAGGTGVLPTCRVALGSSGVLTVGQDRSIVPYVGAAALAQIAEDSGIILYGSIGEGDPPSPAGLPENYVFFRVS